MVLKKVKNFLGDFFDFFSVKSRIKSFESKVCNVDYALIKNVSKKSNGFKYYSQLKKHYKLFVNHKKSNGLISVVKKSDKRFKELYNELFTRYELNKAQKDSIKEVYLKVYNKSAYFKCSNLINNYERILRNYENKTKKPYSNSLIVINKKITKVNDLLKTEILNELSDCLKDLKTYYTSLKNVNNYFTKPLSKQLKRVNKGYKLNFKLEEILNDLVKNFDDFPERKNCKERLPTLDLRKTIHYCLKFEKILNDSFEELISIKELVLLMESARKLESEVNFNKLLNFFEIGKTGKSLFSKTKKEKMDKLFNFYKNGDFSKVLKSKAKIQNYKNRLEQEVYYNF